MTVPMAIDPSFWPHDASVGVSCTAVAPPELPMVTDVENKQPLISLTVMVCVPGARSV